MNLLLRICYRRYWPLLSHVMPSFTTAQISWSGAFSHCGLHSGRMVNGWAVGEKQRVSSREQVPAVWCAPSHPPWGKGAEVTRQQIAATQILNSGPQDWKPDHCIYLAQASSFSLWILECGKDGTHLGHALVCGWNVHANPKSQKHFQLSQCRL